MTYVLTLAEPDEGMIENVATTLFEANRRPLTVTWGDSDDGVKNAYRRDASIAFEAMLSARPAYLIELRKAELAVIEAAKKVTDNGGGLTQLRDALALREAFGSSSAPSSSNEQRAQRNESGE